jgi:hypothetical protein
MNEPTILDRTFHFILRRMMDTGQAPHYTEIAAELGVIPEEGRKTLHELLSGRMPAWVFPGSDYIVSFAPFNNLPTQYRLTIDGQQKWFGQWAFESLAVCWLFPGKTVRIDTPCLDCGLPIRVDIKDGILLRIEPEGVMGYVAVPMWKWYENLPYSWSTMNFFRSEEHIRKWAQFDIRNEEGIISLNDLVKIFSGELFRRRLDLDFFSRMEEYRKERPITLRAIGKTGPFWLPPQS